MQELAEVYSRALFDVARTAWAEAGKPKPHLATSFRNFEQAIC